MKRPSGLAGMMVVLLVLVLGCHYLYKGRMDLYPAYVHAWTQSDRLALAMNFQEEGFDFFHPSTYNLLTKDGVTQVDFPIHDFAVALLSDQFNWQLIPTFRYYNLIYTIIGLLFLYLSIRQLGGSFSRALFSVVFILTIPYFTYYANGFLPSIPSFANLLIAFYFIIRYQQQNRVKDLILVALFLGIAALSRLPFFIFLFAFFLSRLWGMWKRKRLLIQEISILLIPIMCFVAYFLYNQSLGREYGSMFLGGMLPFKSVGHFTEVIFGAIDRWGIELLPPYHLVLLALLLYAALFQFRRESFPNRLFTSLYFYLLICFFGVLIYFILLGQQFLDHDYYYIDSWLPLLALCWILTVVGVRIPNKWYTPLSILGMFFFFYFFSFAKSSLDRRYTPTYDDRIYYQFRIFGNSTKDIQEWTSKDDTLLILDANSTNIPFTLWKRKGYTLLSSKKEIVQAGLDTLPYNYVVLADSMFFLDTYKDFSAITEKLERVKGNNLITLYKYKQGDKEVDFFENRILDWQTDFEGAQTVSWHGNTLTTVEHSPSYGNSMFIAAKEEFNLTIRDTVQQLIPDKTVEVMINADYYRNDSVEIRLVLQAGKGIYQASYLSSEVKDPMVWTRVWHRFQIPAGSLQSGDELVVYYWNPHQDSIYIDNYHLLIFQ
jgi:hypothetical protein